MESKFLLDLVNKKGYQDQIVRQDNLTIQAVATGETDGYASI
jgi:hypothetical protein